MLVRGADKLATCDKRLIEVVSQAAQKFDIIVICGHRTKEEQNKAVAEGKSKTPYPTSKHNSTPSMAVDIIPAEMKGEKALIDWNDTQRICYLAGYIMALAESHGVKLRWGGDWDSDTNLKEEKWRDLVHFELV